MMVQYNKYFLSPFVIRKNKKYTISNKLRHMGDKNVILIMCLVYIGRRKGENKKRFSAIINRSNSVLRNSIHSKLCINKIILLNGSTSY